MRTSRKRAALAVSRTFALFACLVPLAASEAGTTTDLSLSDRILLTLANSISERYQYGPHEVSELAERPDFYMDEDQGLYSFSFRVKGAQHPEYGRYDASGYYKVDVPSEYREPQADEGWRALEDEHDAKVKVWFRQVRQPPEESFNEVRAFLSTGNFVFTVSLRRPSQEPPSAAREAAVTRLQKIIENARRYGLLSRVVVELLGPRETREIEAGARAPIAVSQSGETRIKLRLRAEDPHGQAMTNVAYYTIALEGEMARFVRFENALFNAEKGRYEVHFPPRGVGEVIVVLPAAEDEAFENALWRGAHGQQDLGIGIEVDVTLKPERPSPQARGDPMRAPSDAMQSAGGTIPRGGHWAARSDRASNHRHDF